MKSILLGFLLLSACTAAVNPQMKAATDTRLSAFRTQARTAAAPRAHQPMPWSVGQWVVMRSTEERGEPSVLRVSVVAREADGFWVETDLQDYRHRTVTKVLYSRQPRSLDEVPDLMRKVILRVDGGKPEVLDFTKPDPTAAIVKSTFRQGASGTFFPEHVRPASLEDAVVPAGTFRSCAHVLLTATVAFVRSESDVCFHPAVPVNGIVRSTYRAAGRSGTIELLDYGLTGATSAM